MFEAVFYILAFSLSFHFEKFKLWVFWLFQLQNIEQVPIQILTSSGEHWRGNVDWLEVWKARNLVSSRVNPTDTCLTLCQRRVDVTDTGRLDTRRMNFSKVGASFQRCFQRRFPYYCTLPELSFWKVQTLNILNVSTAKCRPIFFVNI